MLSLAKALVIANHPTLLLHQINYHGLKRKKDEPDELPVEDIHLKTDDGVFERFVATITGTPFPRHAEIRFRDIISCLPSVAEFYCRYYGERPKCLVLHDRSFGTLGQNYLSLSIRVYAYGKRLTAEDVTTTIPELATNFVCDEEPHNQAYRFYTNAFREMPSYMGIYQSPVGGLYLIGGLPSTVGDSRDKRYVHPACAEYMFMFLLSDCVRYRQEFWSRLIAGDQTGVLGIIDIAIAHTVRHFPNFILNELFGQTFTYGSSGIWT
jgi:hypothetical protein